jgi:4-carboxymuconolactone decarboxylase
MSDVTGDAPIMDLAASMTAASLDASNLDGHTLMLVRIAALAAMDAPPISYAVNLAVAGAAGVDGDEVRDVLAAVAPIVGTARVASAVGSAAAGLGMAELAVELQLEDQVNAR